MKTELLLMPDLNDFEFTNIHQWEQQVLKDLGLDDIRAITQIELPEGITQPPYVDSTSTTEKQLVQAYRYLTSEPGEIRQAGRSWMNLAYIPHTNIENANILALEALNGGADGVIFEVNGQIEHRKLLKGILVPACYLGLSGPFDAVYDLCQHLCSSHPELKGFISVDNLAGALDGNTGHHMTGFGDQIKTLVIKEPTTQIGTLEEITRLLCQGILVINFLLESGVPLLDILKNLQFSLKISSQFLWEICRLRCLRILFHQVMEQYGSNVSPGFIPIHAFTSDPVSNTGETKDMTEAGSLHFISNTTQAMSAILGGCDMLSVMPGEEPGDMIQTSRRVARNVSHILREESFFHRSADPVAGSYYLEDLTHKMMKHVWSGLREMERTGGYRCITTQR